MPREIGERFLKLIRTKLTPADKATESVAPEPIFVPTLDFGPDITPNISDRVMPGPEFSRLSPSRRTKKPQIYSGKTGHDLPQIQLEPLSQKVCASFTGPDGGLTKVDHVKYDTIAQMANLDEELTLSADETTPPFVSVPERKHNASAARRSSKRRSPGSPTLCNASSMEMLGLPEHGAIPSTSAYDWNDFDEEMAYGMSISLYEKHPITNSMAGMPIADVFGIVARENNCIIALADGVNWGEGKTLKIKEMTADAQSARLAARCAVRAAIDHMNAAVECGKIENTKNAFHELLRAFHEAHALILQEHGALTTLCVAFIARILSTNYNALCVCNVGDSLCFVYNKLYGVNEITTASRDLLHVRDMRDAGGALGPVDGKNPQLHNLTCSMSFVDDDDIVFLTSDGISDNFDPVVGKHCAAASDQCTNDCAINVAESSSQINNHLFRTASQTTRRLIHHFHKSTSESANKIQDSSINQEIWPETQRRKRAACLLPAVSAHQRHTLMLEHMTDVINNGSKRRILENPAIYRSNGHSKTEDRLRRRMIRDLLSEMPGKLDHASVVAYRIGCGISAISNHDESVDMKDCTTETECDLSLRKPTESKEAAMKLERMEKASGTELVSCDIPVELRKYCHGRASGSSELCREYSPYDENMANPSDVEAQIALSAILLNKDNTVDYDLNRLNKSSKRRHQRGSFARNTLGIDVSWLKRFVFNA